LPFHQTRPLITYGKLLPELFLFVNKYFLNFIYKFPWITSLYTVTAAIGVCHELGWSKSSTNVQGQLRTVLFHGRIGTPFASIIRSTINWNSNHWCLSWVGME